jgi:hypothetical protein
MEQLSKTRIRGESALRSGCLQALIDRDRLARHGVAEIDRAMTTEGFDTAELKDAKALLDELGS